MPKTIEEVQEKLKSHGYTCTRVKDSLLVVPMPMKRYRSPSGTKTAEFFLRFQSASKAGKNKCLTVEMPWAFDAKKAVSKDVFYECLLQAAAATPLLKSQLNPADGEVRFRIDCSCGRRGLRQEDLFRAITTLATFADDWYSRIINVMNLGEPLKSSKEPPAEPKAGESSAASQEVKAIARRAGGVNRLKVLFEFQERLDREKKNRRKENENGNNN